MTKMPHALVKRKEGFTLVELIVVLVILALLAAILVPTLVGYIDKARSEKNYQTAQSVRVAAQAEVDEAYACGTSLTSITSKTATYGPKVSILAGADAKVTAFSFTVDSNHRITGGTVTIDSAIYTLAQGSWTAG